MGPNQPPHAAPNSQLKKGGDVGAEPATPPVSRCFWRLFEWKRAHLGLFLDGPLGLYENPCPFPHIYLLLAVIRTRILFS
jgi:hypothetical protein